MAEINWVRRRFIRQVESVRENSRIAAVAEIARRYFAMKSSMGCSPPSAS